MASPSSSQPDSTVVHIGSKLSAAFERLETRIRELAYEISLGREPDAGDSMADWLDAQMQVLTPIELVVKDQKKNVVVEAVLKGFTPKEVEVEVSAGSLKVFGSHTESKTGKKRGETRSSSETVHFFQAAPLPCEVDVDGSEATLMKNGKLKITLPKKTPVK
jgi:HSP20 family molecular chaperone IbpA